MSHTVCEETQAIFLNVNALCLALPACSPLQAEGFEIKADKLGPGYGQVFKLMIKVHGVQLLSKYSKLSFQIIPI